MTRLKLAAEGALAEIIIATAGEVAVAPGEVKDLGDLKLIPPKRGD